VANESTRGTHADAKALAGEILTDLEHERIPLSNVAMKCARLARLTSDEAAVRWFQFEIGGYPSSIDNASFAIALNAGRGVQEEVKKDAGPRAWTAPIRDIEDSLERLRAIPAAGSLAASSALHHQLMQAERAKFQRLITRLRASIHRWVVEKDYTLRFGDVPTDVFQSAKSIVDAHLGRISPGALEKFLAAQQRAISGAREEWAQALLSLRRMLNDVADALYPPTDEEIDGHRMGEEYYVNRLWQFVKEKAKSDRAAILVSEVQYVGHRIDALYELACKGTHADVSRQEVDLAVVHFYLLVADVLSLLTREELQRLTNATPTQS